MSGLEALLVEWGPVGVLAIAFLLGMWHATDPDHVTAVASIVLGERGPRARSAASLGAAWGAGHATTLLAFGLPLVLWRHVLPASVERAAEIAIGLLIVALAGRLLVRWRRGYLHVHPHRHDDLVHAHPHAHEHAHGGARLDPPAHRHSHGEALGRTPLAAFGIGLVHGLAGSSGAALLLVAAIDSRAVAALALIVFAAATAVAMGLSTWAVGQLLTRRRVALGIEAALPLFGALGLLFGAGYALSGLGVAPIR